MAESDHHHHHHHLGAMAKDRCWDCLVLLAKLLSEGNVRLEELTKEVDDHAPTTIFKRAKRSPRRSNANTWIKIAAAGASITQNKGGEKNIKKRPSDEYLGQTLSSSTSPNFPCKRKKGFELGECSRSAPARKKIILRIPKVEPTLPEAVKNRILDVGGCLESAVFLIEKKLSVTDANPQQGRMSLPYLKLKNKFLQPNELEELRVSTEGFLAYLIQPCVEECPVTFTDWKSNGMYALKRGWNYVSRNNAFNDETVVRLWSFRRNSELCFALTKVEKD